MEQRLQVRRIGKADAPAYFRLRARAQQEEAGPAEPRVRREVDPGPSEMSRRLAHYCAEGTRVWGAFDAGALVGALCLSRPHAPQYFCAACLWGAYVIPRYRGTPVSRLLVEAVLDWSERELQVCRLVASVPRDNIRALRFFERFGFEPLGRTDGGAWQAESGSGIVCLQRRA